MLQKPIITCAVTGNITTVEQNPNLPVTPEQIADAVLEAAEEGAAITHIHVRDPKTGRPSMELDHYREVMDRVAPQQPRGGYQPDHRARAAASCRARRIPRSPARARP